MFNLKYLLLLALISYTLQDSHCLVTVEYCEKEDDGEEKIDNGGIDHCTSAGEGIYHHCEDGYAVSSNKKSCISFQNCYELEEGDKKCKKCAYHYHQNSEGNCVGTLCQQYDNKDVCTKCFDGYYLKNNECKKITIPHCNSVDEKDETKCTRCLWILADPVDGKCIAPTTWIQGCSKYDTNGKCTDCTDYYSKSGDTCKFTSSCPKGRTHVESCDICEAGFLEDYDGICIGHDGTKDTSSNATRIKIDFTLLLFILAILI